MGESCCSMESKSGCGPSSCGSGGCGCECHSCGCCSQGMDKDKMMFMMFMELADQAWMKLTKQKMIAIWEKKIGKDMEKSAEFFVEQSMMKWMNKEQWKANAPKAMETFAKMMADKKK